MRFYCGSYSSFVSQVTYHPGKLTVRFKKNANKYEYFFVPKAVFAELFNAESVGAAYGELVKGKYPCRKVKTKKKG